MFGNSIRYSARFDPQINSIFYVTELTKAKGLKIKMQF